MSPVIYTHGTSKNYDISYADMNSDLSVKVQYWKCSNNFSLGNELDFH